MSTKQTISETEREAMNEYVDWLPPKQRRDYVACDIRGLTHQQQANDRGVKQPVVTQSVVIARKRLLEIAEGKGEL